MINVRSLLTHWKDMRLVYALTLLLFIPVSHATGTLGVGNDHACAVKADGTLICWGDDTYNQITDVPTGTYTQVASGGSFSCALASDGSIACWGRDTAGETTPWAGSNFVQVDAGLFHACGLTSGGNAYCWGDNSQGQISFPPGPFSMLALGDLHSCGLGTDGTVLCWGYNNNGQRMPPAETFVSIGAGFRTTCGVKADGTGVCWGRSSSTGTEFIDLQQVAIADQGSSWRENSPVPVCGLKTDGTLVCPSATAATDLPPSSHFSFIDAGGHDQYENHSGAVNDGNYYYAYACGVQTNGIVACWGRNHLGRMNAPVVLVKQPDSCVFYKTQGCGLPTAASCSLDIDGDETYDALTDGVLVLRYLLGLTGVALTEGATNGNARTDSEIEAYIPAMMP